MSSKYWIKLYLAILDDPKMGRLPDKLFRRCIQIFLLAGEHGNDGKLPALADAAWRLRVAEDDLQHELAELEKLGIVTKTDGGWLVTNFAKRQAASEAKERMRQYRERKKAEKQENSNGNVTSVVTFRNECYAPESESDSESDSLPKGNGAAAPATFEPEGQTPKTQDGQGDPVVTKSELEPANEREALLFELLKPEFIAKGRRPPGKFPSLACKRKYVARANYLGDSTSRAIERALEKNITSITQIVDFIAKWDPANESRQNGAAKHTGSNQTNIAGLREKGTDNPIKKQFDPYTGETFYVDIRSGERVPGPVS